MSWLQLADAASKGFSREAWESWIENGQATSYVDSFGRRMVWVDEAAPLQLALQGFTSELFQLRHEVSIMREELRATLSARPPIAAPAAQTQDVELSEAASQTLTLVSEHWEGSDRELERQAALPHRFLTKARRGERNGKRAKVSWDRLREFLRAA